MKRILEDGEILEPEKKKVKLNSFVNTTQRRKYNATEKKTDDWIYSQPLWMCKGCGLHNYCDKMRCFGCKLERPVEEEKPKEKEISEESISKNGFKMLKPGELTNSLLAAAEALASTQAITNTPIEPDPEPTKTEPKRVRRSRFDRAPPSMEKAKATTASA